jgi:NAD(P)H-dependent flavin oxidoreductase YrpB (nitropropane dioxygenase family)
VSERPGEGEFIATWPRGQIVRYTSLTPSADIEGDVEALSMWAGQSVGLLSKVQPAADIVRKIADEARSTLQRVVTGFGA